MKKIIILAVMLLNYPILVFTQNKVYKFPPVKYVSLIKDINNYYLYANGGFHADWYVGYNNAWIVNLGTVSTYGYSKAYIGVKLGRAKNKTYPQPLDLSPLEGKIVVSISQDEKFPSFSYVLTENADIPMEALSSENIKKVDSAKWFWAEVPINKISQDKNNYIAVWAQSKDFTSSSKSPIIAAGYLDDGKENVWVNHSIKGSMPHNESALETPISGIKPAIILKLIQENDYRVVIKNFSYESIEGSFIFNWNVIGADITRSWIEISYDKLEWKRIGDNIYSPPYFISFGLNELPKDVFYLRACAADIFENTECSNSINLNLIK